VLSAGFGSGGSWLLSAPTKSGRIFVSNGLIISGKKSAVTGTASKTSAILSITSCAASKGLAIPSSCALISNKSNLI